MPGWTFKTAPYGFLFRLFLAAFVLVLGVSWIFKIRNIQRLKGEIVALESKLSSGQETWRNFPPLTPVERKELLRAQYRLFNMLPRDKEIPSLLQEISRLARDYKLEDASFKIGDGASPAGAAPTPVSAGAAPQAVAPQPTTPVPAATGVSSSGPVESFSVKVTFAGDYREIAYFLDAVRKLPRLVAIQSLKIQRGAPLLPVELVLRAYYQRGELPVGGK